ncbi:MAG: alginate lyase family protein [Planctomycetota bacterium]|jgi:hypothetical protein|nr:alginate lyase family protein [Planctomycetota bacterium]
MPSFRHYLLNADALRACRGILNDADRDFLRQEAESALQRGPFTVARRDKPQVPGAGCNDYVSLGSYWWPDPNTADGLPYIRRDGELNPDYDRYDRKQLEAMQSTVKLLALAWWHLNDERYAEHAVLLLHTWYRNPATAMTPHLRFGQGIPGICHGRCIGIIDTHDQIWMLEYLPLLLDARCWDPALGDTIRVWFGSYVTWLREDPLGQEEAATKNNHGSWYDAQVVHFASLAGNDDLARSVLEQVGERRILSQIETDGRQPHELARTLSRNYTMMNLTALSMLAKHAQRFDIDLWTLHSASSGGLAAAFSWLAPYADGSTAWPYQQISPFRHGVHALLTWRWADQAYGTTTETTLHAQCDSQVIQHLRLLG